MVQKKIVGKNSRNRLRRAIHYVRPLMGIRFRNEHSLNPLMTSVPPFARDGWRWEAWGVGFLCVGPEKSAIEYTAGEWKMYGLSANIYSISVGNCKLWNIIPSTWTTLCHYVVAQPEHRKWGPKEIRLLL